MKKVIVFGNDHTNSVGVIQSLGKAGYESVGLLYGAKTDLVISSNYTSHVITARDPQACIDKLLVTCIDSDASIPIIATCDMAALTLERNEDCLKERFLFEHSVHYTLEYLSKKENQVRLAEEAGFNVPKSWNLKDKRFEFKHCCGFKPSKTSTCIHVVFEDGTEISGAEDHLVYDKDENRWVPLKNFL